MAESTLSVDYQTLVRDAARKLAIGRTYSKGTVTIATGTVTLTGGRFPSWAESSAIQVGDETYQVSARGGDTTLTITNTTAAATSLRYVMLESGDSDRLDAFEQINDIIAEALRAFYAPQMIEIPRTKTYDQSEAVSQTSVMRTPHTWSFLRPDETLNITSAATTYALPDDCGGVTSDWVIYVDNDSYPLHIIPPGHLRAMRSIANGIPRYVCVRPADSFSAATGQRYEVEFDCPPQGAYVVHYRYNVLPNQLNPTNRYPYGGAMHSETIRAAVLSRAELYLGCEEGTYAAEYAKRLAASLHLDVEVKESESISYVTSKPDMGTYNWLRQEIAAAIGENPNYASWGNTMIQRFDSYIQRGLRRFYRTQLSGLPHHLGHRWSFLNPTIQIDLHAPYTTGTVTVEDGIVTMTTGFVPEWVLDCEFVVGDSTSRVVAVQGPKVFVLQDRTLSADAGSEYSLNQKYYRLPGEFSGIDGQLHVVGDTGWSVRTIDVVSGSQYMKAASTYVGTGLPRLCTLESMTPGRNGLHQVSGTYHELAFLPAPSEAVSYRATSRFEPGILGPGDIILGGPGHFDTALLACISIAEPKRINEFRELLAASIEFDQSEFTPATVGYNLDNALRNGHDGVFTSRGISRYDMG